MLGEKKDDKYSFVGNNAYSRFFGFSLKTLPTEKAYQKCMCFFWYCNFGENFFIMITENIMKGYVAG